MCICWDILIIGTRLSLDSMNLAFVFSVFNSLKQFLTMNICIDFLSVFLTGGADQPQGKSISNLDVLPLFVSMLCCYQSGCRYVSLWTRSVLELLLGISCFLSQRKLCLHCFCLFLIPQWLCWCLGITLIRHYACGFVLSYLLQLYSHHVDRGYFSWITL